MTYRTQNHCGLRARAILCEARSHDAVDVNLSKEWAELAIEWHALANAAAHIEGLT